MKTLFTAGSLALAMVTASSASISFTVEAPGVETPGFSGICAGKATCITGFETFSASSGPGFSTNYGIAGSPITGTYTGGYHVLPADQFGGAGGAGYYPVVFNNSYTLTLATQGVPGVNYFGFWLSALDGGNQIQFYKGNTQLAMFTYSDFIQSTGGCGANPYCGNPSGPFAGYDSRETYSYVNFFDSNGYFDKIVFTELGFGGFETDNHAVGFIATATPEPGGIGLAAVGGGILGAVVLFRRRALARAAAAAPSN